MYVCVFIGEGGGGKWTVGIKNADSSILCPIKCSSFLPHPNNLLKILIFFLFAPLNVRNSNICKVYSFITVRESNVRTIEARPV